MGQVIEYDFGDWFNLKRLREDINWMKKQNTGNFDVCINLETLNYKTLLKDYVRAA